LNYKKYFSQTKQNDIDSFKDCSFHFKISEDEKTNNLMGEGVENDWEREREGERGRKGER